MAFIDTDYNGLTQRVQRYLEILQNTINYRAIWQSELRQGIIDQLKAAADTSGLKGRVEHRSEILNLEAVVFNLGAGSSGLGEPVTEGIKRDLIKQNGSLVYQQLFNGKILVLINYPFIEKYGQPQPAKTIAIYRPEEIKVPFILRHLETFIAEITSWEDYDDDAPEPNQRIGFKMNFDATATPTTEKK
jgi:hypothetical protein